MPADRPTVVLKCRAAYHLGLIDDYPPSCILPDGTIVMWGRRSYSSDTSFHFYHRNGRYSINRLCNHDEYIYLQYLRIARDDYIAVSCWECSLIRLIDLSGNRETIVAYKGDVGPMCPGSEGVLYTVDEANAIQVLDCTKAEFTLLRSLGELSELGVCPITYVSTSELIVLSSEDQGRICSVSNKGSMAWQVKDCYPSVTVYLPEYDLLLAAENPRYGIVKPLT